MTPRTMSAEREAEKKLRRWATGIVTSREDDDPAVSMATDVLRVFTLLDAERAAHDETEMRAIRAEVRVDAAESRLAKAVGLLREAENEPGNDGWADPWNRIRAFLAQGGKP